MNKLRIGLLLAASFILNACISVDARYSYDAETDFSKYQTYDWLPDVEDGFNLPANAKSFIEAVDTQLGIKGYSMDTGAPDFLISTKPSNTYKEVYISPYYGRVVFPYGSLKFELLDAKSREPIWEGVINGQFSLDSKQSTQHKTVVKGVEKVLSGFPPS